MTIEPIWKRERCYVCGGGYSEKSWDERHSRTQPTRWVNVTAVVVRGASPSESHPRRRSWQ
jgi:hypothetical protein